MSLNRVPQFIFMINLYFDALTNRIEQIVSDLKREITGGCMWREARTSEI